MSLDVANSLKKHSRPSSESSRPAYPRKRAAQACYTCRRRRTKCDNERPACTSCTKLEIECVYQESDKSSFDSASLAILQRLDILEDLFKIAHPETLGPRGIPRQQTPDATPQIDASPVPEQTLPSKVYCINIETALEWPALQVPNQIPRQPLKTIIQSSTPNQGPRLLSTSDLDATDTGLLLQRFLESFHVYNPVLEISLVEEYVKSTVYNGLGWDSESCISLLIFALGTIAVPNVRSSSDNSSAFRQSEQFQRAESFFLAAQRRMGPALCCSGIIEAQIFFLAGVYLMTTIRPFEAWRMFIQALSCCQTLQPSSGDQQQEGSQMYRSIYWTCFKSELELRLELNIAENSVWNLQYPEFFPAPPKSLQSQGEGTWYFYLAEIALRRLGNRILTHTCQFRSSQGSVGDQVSKTIDFEQQAYSWLDSLPNSLRLEGPLSDKINGKFEHASLRFILNGHLLDCYEMMYWPFMVDEIHGVLHVDPSARVFAQKGFEICVRRIKENESGFQHRHHGTWLMLRSCTRSALVLLAAARSSLDEMLPAEWRTCVTEVMELLRYWKDEVLDAASQLVILDELLRSMP
ncbi:hypothetical protein B0J13DRAFT_556988 [Dactylonectria estremocensis]|uniref:Zn(2)-C6 fungal-type domain-containing protein n=1 Tax=Dactylonectria estremocensis TaxID=1079267 RepID=A0A9P9J553_9HYPO|nr:hypothetical protein B0J13DRAFT_556988 [Dactylonectria estremocensis]